MRKPQHRKKKSRVPKPVMFERAPVERPYDRIAKRVLAAVEELNKALTEAHECAEMRVFIGASKTDGESMRFQPQIYNLTHATLNYRVTFKEDNSTETEYKWQQVKDPKFQDAAGQAFNALPQAKTGEKK